MSLPIQRCAGWFVAIIVLSTLLGSGVVQVAGEPGVTAAPGGGLVRAQDIVAHTAVIGGTPARGPFFSSIAHVGDLRGAEVTECTGTVIAPTAILTAGHCVENDAGEVYPAAGYQVATHLLSYNSSGRELSGVSKVLIFPGFDQASDSGDAAVLILAVPTTAPAVRLAGASSELLRAGTRAVVAGWGQLTPTGDSPDEVHRGDLVAQSNAWCRQHARTFDAGTETCAIDPHFKITTCYGDSGSPLLVGSATHDAPTEIGVASRSSIECSPRYPTVFTRVSALSRWLARTVHIGTREKSSATGGRSMRGD